MTVASLAFIGAGNMASSIIGGLIKQGYSHEAITACDPNTNNLQTLHARFGIQTNSDNSSACRDADIIVLSVKPQILKTVVKALQSTMTARSSLPLIISIAAGISSQTIQQWIGCDVAIVRCMPNTPALVQEGASALYANRYTNTLQKQQAEELLKSVGYSCWVDEESLMDAVTAVSGSGPAYFFLFMEAMIEAGVQQGLDYRKAVELTLQTALGAAKLAKNSDVAIDELRRRVTSPGGTTERALQHFEQAGLKNTVSDAMKACANHSKDMAKTFS